VDPSKKLVIVNKLGAPSRQGEEQAVLVVLNQLLETRPSLQVVHLPEGTIDGGDVLFTGNMVLIGNSHRTSLEGIKALEKILSEFDLPVVTIPVVSGLHLKSCCSLIDKGVILISDNVAGKHIRGEIERLVPAENALQFIVIPDAVASNVLRIGHNIVIQDGFPLSEAILSGYAALKGFTIHKLNMSEFIKADGALTCCNVLLDI
jgi:dimethylargininase